jgi:hypothetical protein
VAIELKLHSFLAFALNGGRWLHILLALSPRTAPLKPGVLQSQSSCVHLLIQTGFISALMYSHSSKITPPFLHGAFKFQGLLIYLKKITHPRKLKMQSFLNIITFKTYTFFTTLTPQLHGRSRCFFRGSSSSFCGLPVANAPGCTTA